MNAIKTTTICDHSDDQQSVSSPLGKFSSKVQDPHLCKLAIVYVRQSTQRQVVENRESRERQYALVQRAEQLGWVQNRILVLDDDQGISGSSADNRPGFQRLMTEVSLKHVGMVLGLELSRLSRSCKDWHHLIEVCGLFGSLLGDEDSIYDPLDSNDRLLLGMKGAMSEFELVTITTQNVGDLIRRLNLRGELFRDGMLGKDEWWIPDLAHKLGVIQQKVHYWAKQGWIHSRQTPTGKHWIVWADRDELRRLRKLKRLHGSYNYYRIAHDFNRAANTLDFHAYWIGVKALCRRYDIPAAQCIRKYGQGDNLNVGGSYTLKRAQAIQMSWKQESPKPYTPGTGCYLDDVDWEAEIRQYENRQRPGRMDFKAMTLFRDGHRCRQCGSRVTLETSETDHIKSVSCFASYAQANHLFNLQTLCLRCHKLKHCAKSSRHSGKPDAGKACTSGLGLGPG